MEATVVVELLKVIPVELKIFACWKDLHVEEFVSELSEDALDVSVLPRRSQFDEARFNTFCF